VNKIDTAIAANLYNSRFDQYGRDIRTVGWGSASSQRLRFDLLFRGLDPRGKTILDVGCGLGDLVTFLDLLTDGDFNYIGIDIAEKLIDHAAQSYPQTERKFMVGDIFSVSLPKIDIAVLSGALSLKVDNIDFYAYETMARMFTLSQEAACLNFLSKYVDFEAEKNQHYQPELIFSKAMQISRRVNLFHDYPLYEFTVQMLK